MIFKAATRDGRLIMKDRISFEAHLRELHGKDIVIVIEHSVTKTRSIEQNRLYYGILRKIMRVLVDRGYDNLNVVALNNYFKSLFLQDVMIDLLTGKEREIIKSPSELGVKLFAEYIDKVIRFALQDMNIDSQYLEPYITEMK